MIDAALREVLRPGQDVVVGQAWGTPRRLLAALGRHLDRLDGSRVFLGMLVEDIPPLPGASIETFFPSGPLGSVDDLARHGAVYRRQSLFELASAFRSGARNADVVLAQASPARGGRRSLGVAVDYIHAAAEHAGAVVVETSPRVPWTGAASAIAGDRLITCPCDDAPPPLQRAASSADRAIARNVSTWIPDEATLQLGMAPWVDPLTDLLHARRGLRVHSGLISDWVATLGDAGALDRSACIVATGAGGTAGFYAWLDGNPRVELAPADVTHAPSTLSTLRRMRAVNSVLEVDLDGNVNCEVGRNGRRGGVAGLRDFAVAAAAHSDALSIIALTSTARGSSRIVPRLAAEEISLPPGSVDVVVTEHGSADLRGATPSERAHALLAIAAPEHRADLEVAWRSLTAEPLTRKA